MERMLIKLALKHRSENNKGFTLIELILSLSLISLILLTVFNIMHYSIMTSNVSRYKDEILTNGRYGLEYMINEIKSADKIIDSNLIQSFNTEYPNNLGFVLYNFHKGSSNEAERHEFTSYYVRNNRLQRIKRSRDSGEYENIRIFSPLSSGDNPLCGYVIDASKTDVNYQDEIINLKIVVGNDEFSYEFKTMVNISCIMDY